MKGRRLYQGETGRGVTPSDNQFSIAVKAIQFGVRKLISETPVIVCKITCLSCNE